MANSDKNIVITPNIGSATDNPKVVFSGADSSTAAQDITLYAYPTDNGTISFEGSAGQLFSITNDLTGTIFSVNDVSGIPSIEVDADGTIRLAEFGGNVLIGTATDDGTNLLQVDGSVLATAFSGPLSGNATTATTLQTARTINGVSFNGSANITVADATKLPLTGGTMTGTFNLGNQKIQFPSGSASGSTFAANHYSMGIDIADGGWTGTNYSDLIIGYHTGVRIGGGYSGVRFYNNSPTTDANNDGNGDGGEALLMTIGGGGTPTSGADVTINNSLSVGGTITNQNDAITKARMMGWVPAYSNSTESTVKWDTAQAAVALGPIGAGGMAYKAIKMKAAQTVRIAMQMKGSTADTDGVYIRVYHYAGDLPDGKTHVSNDAAYTLVQEDTSGDTAWKENTGITTSYVGYERTYTAPADGYMSIVVLNWSGYGGILYCKQPDIQFEPPTGGATISDKSDNVNYNVIFTSETSGSQTLAGIDTGTFTFNPSTGTLKAPEVQATSDETLKTNIVTIPAPLEKLEVIRGVNFNWKENNRYAMGVIAQEVEKVIPEAVGIDENGIRSVNYASLVGLLIEAVKTLSDRIDDLEGK